MDDGKRPLMVEEEDPQVEKRPLPVKKEEDCSSPQALQQFEGHEVWRELVSVTDKEERIDLHFVACLVAIVGLEEALITLDIEGNDEEVDFLKPNHRDHAYYLDRVKDFESQLQDLAKIPQFADRIRDLPIDELVDADDTALRVALNGSHYEKDLAKMESDHFKFLNPNDHLHVYYQQRLAVYKAQDLGTLIEQWDVTQKWGQTQTPDMVSAATTEMQALTPNLVSTIVTTPTSSLPPDV